jgi:hypothetical protein
MKRKWIITHLVILVLGGTAVLYSYAHGIINNPDTRGLLWGNVPEGLLPLYTVSMFSAATGFFLFSFYVLFKVDPESSRVADRLPASIYYWIYVFILVPSALWMPLTFAYLEAPSAGLWTAIRAVLFLVGLASAFLIYAIATTRPGGGKISRVLALLGSVLFTFQTLVLDALVWPWFFPTG